MNFNNFIFDEQVKSIDLNNVFYECNQFVNRRFNELKKTGVVKVSNGFDGGKLFDFNSIENSTLEKLISELSSQSSPGVSSIKNNNYFYTGKHGFRKGFSWKTALHELISEINDARDKRLIM